MDLSLAASDEPEIPPAMQVIQVPVLEFSADKPKKTLDQQPSTTREGASIETTALTSQEASQHPTGTTRSSSHITLKRKIQENLAKAKKRTTTLCHICKGVDVASKDNRRSGRWVGCEREQSCGIWVHRKCINWSESDVDTREYLCDKCTSN